MISIIIPTLNEEKDIEKTFLSLKELNVCDYEIIISDGRSRDKTIEIAKKYGAKVVIYAGEKRQTISNARNLGARVATGDIFLFIDADVTIPDINNFFLKVLKIFEKNKKLVALSVRMRVLPEMETRTDRIIYFIFDYLNFLSNNIFHMGTAYGEFQMMRALTFKKLKGYNEAIAVAEDVDMFKRLSKEGRTKVEMSLCVFQTGRRAHKVGWTKLLFDWSLNGISVRLFKRSFNSVWEEVR
jgi:glycosyltransferase involved in cell wall biosynthesis